VKKLIASLAATAAAVAGCSIANTTASEVALQYGAGPFDSRVYVSCVPVNTREINDVNDDHYYYPAGQRDFTFAHSGGDAAPLASNTRDSLEIKVSGTVKFTLNTDCSEFTDPSGKKWPGGRLQMFHELIANKFGAAPTDGGEQMPDGWKTLLTNYLLAAIDRAVDNEALKYGYGDLYTNTEKKAAWERDVLAQIPEILRGLTQGVDLITINSVLLQKPEVPGQIVNGFADKQAAELRAQAVEIDKSAAALFPGGIAAYQAYQQQQAVNQAIKDGKVQVIPVPAGSPVIVQAR
jgi:hypothetical protein